MTQHEEIKEILENLDRKLLLIMGERKKQKRAELINSILYDEDGEMVCLKAILKIKEN